MKQLFNNENRIAVILKNIEMQSVCSVESLAAKLDVSQKTIRNDIKELNCLLGGYACIGNNKGICKLIVFAPKGFTEIRNKIYKQEDLFNSSHTRMAYMFWQLMHAEEPYLTDDLSEEMKVARTTTIGDLNRLRKAIEKYDLKIKGKANTGLALCGDEFNIRLFILENIYEQLYLNFPLGQTIREKLYDFQERLSMDALGFGFFYRFFVVMIQRMESGHTIKKLKPKYEELYESSAYMIVDEFLNEIEQVKGYKISKEERLFLSISVAGMRTPANTAEIEQKISISEGVADLIIEILDRIKAELNVTVVANELFDDFPIDDNDYPEDNAEVKLERKNFRNGNIPKEINLVIEDTYPIEYRQLPRLKASLPTIRVYRERGNDLSRHYSPELIKTVSSELRQLPEGITVNIFATLNPKNMLYIARNALAMAERGNVKHLYVFQQKSIDSRHFNDNGKKIY